MKMATALPKVNPKGEQQTFDNLISEHD